MQSRILSFSIIVLSTLIFSCTANKKLANGNPPVAISSIKMLGKYELPYNMLFKGTFVGGLSSIDYDAKTDLYYLICDDPSAFSPARFYTAKIFLNQQGIDSVSLVDVDTLYNSEGKLYTDITKDRIHSADLESMRYHPLKNTFVYGTEGQRHLKKDGELEIQQPAIIIMDKHGKYKDSFALPANMHYQTIEKGPRHNSVFEGLDYTDNYRHLFVNVEEPLYEDGPRAGLGDSTAWVRFLKFDTKTKKQVAQYAYKIDPVPYPPVAPNTFKINGIPDIMYIGNNKFLAIERAYSQGRRPSDVRVYIADINGADDVSKNTSFVEHPVQKPITKKLLFNFSTEINQLVFNIEGVTFGPRLPNGHQTLVFVTDNNFDKLQASQFWLFEVME